MQACPSLHRVAELPRRNKALRGLSSGTLPVKRVAYCTSFEPNSGLLESASERLLRLFRRLHNAFSLEPVNRGPAYARTRDKIVKRPVQRSPCHFALYRCEYLHFMLHVRL